MYCQQCGASVPDQSKFCKQCGRRLKSYISNKALLLAMIAAVVSVGTSLPLLFSSDKPMKAEGSPTPLVVATSPSLLPKASPFPSPSPRPTRTPKQEVAIKPISELSPKPIRPRPDPTATPD